MLSSTDLEQRYICKLLDEHDLAQLQSIENEVHLIPWSKKKILDCFKIESYQSIGLFKGPQLRGYAVLSIHSRDAELQNFAIAKVFQNQGLGNFFLTKVIHHLSHQAISNVMLEVRVSNYQAIKLYKACGFEQVGMRKNYYKTKTAREHALLYTLEL